MEGFELLEGKGDVKMQMAPSSTAPAPPPITEQESQLAAEALRLMAEQKVSLEMVC